MLYRSLTSRLQPSEDRSYPGINPRLLTSMAPTATESEKILALLNGPAGIRPSGVAPNLDNPPNANAFIIPTITVCIVASTLAVTIRLYAKLFLIRSMAYEDCMF